jgi:hypothetical protein
MSQENNAPVQRIRIGSVSVAIFENTTDDGAAFYNAQFDRSYRSGDEWKRTRSFGRDDLLVLAKLSNQAHTWIVDQLQNQSDPEADEQ